MIRGLLAIEVVVLVLLMQTNHFLKQKFNSNVNQIQSTHCSRGRSLIVRTVLIQKFYPIITAYNITLPLQCPFHLDRAEISNLDRNSVPDDSVCLADYCDIIRCDILIGSEKRNYLLSSFKSSSSVENSKNTDCDKDRLKNLYEKCTTLIRQCTLGTLDLNTLDLGSSMKEFYKLENELSKSICSFLSCDLYWENNLDRFRNVSIKFIVVLILLVICLFSICYYLVWNLFESDYSYYNQLQIGTKLQSTVNKVVDLANLVQLVYLVNLVKSKWLCKRIKKDEIKLENSDLERNRLRNEFELITQRNQFPAEMKQSIFSIRSSSSESIKKMHLEHLRNLELHEQQRLKELESERLNENKISEQKIIEEENSIDDEIEKEEYENELNKNLNGECVLVGSARRFTNDGEIVSTKSDDKESFYEAQSDLRKGSSGVNSNELLVDNNERKDQRRLSKQSICTNLDCPNRKTTDDYFEPEISILRDFNEIKSEPLEPDEDERISKAEKENSKKDKDDRSAKSLKRRLWEVAGDITLLNAAKLKLLETKRAASRQLNYQMNENIQSNQLCKDSKKKSIKPEIELKEFSLKESNFPKKIMNPFRIQTEQNYNNQTNTSNSPNLMSSNSLSLINQMDQSKESRKKFLYKQSLSSRSSSVQTTKPPSNYQCRETMPQTKKIMNPILNQVIYQQTRSQPPSLHSRPASTNSTPYR